MNLACTASDTSGCLCPRFAATFAGLWRNRALVSQFDRVIKCLEKWTCAIVDDHLPAGVFTNRFIDKTAGGKRLVGGTSDPRSAKIAIADSSKATQRHIEIFKRKRMIMTGETAELKPDSSTGSANRRSGGNAPSTDRDRRRKNLYLDDPKTYERLQKMVRKVCPPWLVREREDLGQKAMLRLLERAQRLSESDSEICAAYLYRVANSIVIDEIRKRNREVLADNVEDFRGSSSQDKREELVSLSTPLGQLRAKELRQAMEECLSNINMDRRRATGLRLQGFTVSEISKILEWKIKKAENMERRGRLELRSCLSKKGFQVQC